jgi:hypothetical protein
MEVVISQRSRATSSALLHFPDCMNVNIAHIWYDVYHSFSQICTFFIILADCLFPREMLHSQVQLLEYMYKHNIV